MDDDSLELVKAATEGAAEGVVSGLLAPISSFASAVFGAPAKEVGKYFGDAIRLRRFQMQIRVFTEAKAMCESAGIDPERVAWKILVPLLDAAANEDGHEDDSMVKRWAALLANAAAGERGADVMPSFPAILAQLLPAQALVLETLYSLQARDWDGARYVHDSSKNPLIPDGHEGVPVKALAVACDLPFDQRFLISVDDLERHELVYVPVPATYGGLNELVYRQGGLANGSGEVLLTFYGRTFMEACRPPGERSAPPTASGVPSTTEFTQGG